MLYVYIRQIFEDDARHLHDAAYALLFDALRRDFFIEPLTLRLERTAEGKPYFTNCAHHFSLSHTDGLVAVAISDMPVGIDAEPNDRMISDAVAKRFLKSEHVSVRDWTRYESIGKMLGCGVPLDELQMKGKYHTYFFDDLPRYTLCCTCEKEQAERVITIL